MVPDVELVVGAEEFDVAADRAGGDFEFVAEAGVVGEAALLDDIEDGAEPGIEVAGGMVVVAAWGGWHRGGG